MPNAHPKRRSTTLHQRAATIHTYIFRAAKTLLLQCIITFYISPRRSKRLKATRSFMHTQGEPYITLEQFQRREKNKQKAKNVADVPFRPTNPPKSPCGNLGSNYGTVGYSDKNTKAFPEGGKILYVPQGDTKKLSRADVKHEPYNIVTNPIRKGTFGYVNTTIGVPSAAGTRRGWKGVTGEYAYLPDPYDSTKIAEREFKKKQPPQISEVPFRPANPPKRGGPGMWGVRPVCMRAYVWICFV
jgi:hypothetical protein